MNKTSKIIKYVLLDVIRSRWLLIYTLFFFITSYSLFRLGGGGERVILSLMNIILFIIPLISIIFGSMYLYHSREFIELLLSQPISRKMLYCGIFFGLAAPLSLGYLIGVGIPFLIYANGASVMILGFLLISGVLLTFIFVALAFFISVAFEDKVKGFGLSILVWLLFSVIYDGFILFVAYIFEAYPLEKPMIALSLLNPIDLARILLLLKTDFSALMGYTGVIFHNFFGNSIGMIVAGFFLITWSTVPYLLGMRLFARKDF